jgi:hypothetical protein
VYVFAVQRTVDSVPFFLSFKDLIAAVRYPDRISQVMSVQLPFKSATVRSELLTRRAKHG